MMELLGSLDRIVSLGAGRLLTVGDPSRFVLVHQDQYFQQIRFMDLFHWSLVIVLFPYGQHQVLDDGP